MGTHCVTASSITNGPLTVPKARQDVTELDVEEN